MTPLSVTSKLLTMGGVLARNPRDIRFFSGWFRSMLPNHSPLSDEIPWVSFRAIEWLNAYVRPHMVVFEYGSGGSTLFLARRARQVVSVEHDVRFHKVVAGLLEKKDLDNCTLLLREPEPLPPGANAIYGTSSFTSAQAQYRGLSFECYVTTIDDYPDQSYDLVVVDGRARSSCVKRAIPKVRPGGYLLLDNSERTGYVGATELLKRYSRTDFFGLVPCNLEPYQTSIWRIEPST